MQYIAYQKKLSFFFSGEQWSWCSLNYINKSNSAFKDRGNMWKQFTKPSEYFKDESEKTLGKRVKFHLLRWIICELLQIGLTFLTALVLFNQLNYLNHANKDSDWFIVACFMRVWSMLMTLLFALKIKFVLKIESDAWGTEQIDLKQIENPWLCSVLLQSTTSRVSPYTSFPL